MLRYSLTFLAVLSVFGVLASPVIRKPHQSVSSPAPTPASPKGPGAFRAEKAAMHLHNAAHAAKETVAYSTLPISGAIGGAKAPLEAAKQVAHGDMDYAGQKLKGTVERPLLGAIAGAKGVPKNAGRAVKHVACAAGQLCGYVGDRVAGRKDTPEQRASRYQANGDKLREAKADSSEKRKEITNFRKDGTRDLLGMSFKARS